MCSSDLLYNKAGCKNITVKNSKIVGNRGVVANHTKNDGDAINSIHENIILTGNNITGLKGEGVVLFNTKSATVKNNKIKSLRKGKSDAYTVGLHITTFSNNKALKKAVFKIMGNTIHGKDGSITDVKVVQSAHSTLDREAIRLVKAMPKWIPGKQNGNTVRAYFTQPIRFVLRN